MLIAHSEIDDNRVDVGDVGFMCLITNSEDRDGNVNIDVGDDR
jgi:hypothetical protein